MEDAFLGDLAIKSRYRRCRASSTGSFSNSSPFNFRHAYTAARSIHVDILKWTTRCMLFGAYQSPPLVPLDAHEPSIIYRTFPPYFYLSYDWRSRWPTGGNHGKGYISGVCSCRHSSSVMKLVDVHIREPTDVCYLENVAVVSSLYRSVGYSL
ncbi:hypothetical protein BHM03_00061668 [Ensete ventricosum]|nr:hypothetical protein BHM03_00061668 [Ensete ventricosum]